MYVFLGGKQCHRVRGEGARGWTDAGGGSAPEGSVATARAEPPDPNSCTALAMWQGKRRFGRRAKVPVAKRMKVAEAHPRDPWPRRALRSFCV